MEPLAKQKMAGKPSMAKQNPKNVCEGQTERGGGKWGGNVHTSLLPRESLIELLPFHP